MANALPSDTNARPRHLRAGAIIAAALLGVVCVTAWLWTWWHDRPPEGLARRLEADEGRFSSLVFSRDGNYLAAGAASGRVFLWDFPAGKALPLFQHSKQPVTSLATTGDGFLVAATLGKRLIVWDMRSQQARIAPPLPLAIVALAAHPTRAELALALQDGTLQFLDTKSAEFTTVPSGHQGAIKVLHYDPRGEFLVSGGADGRIVVRESATREVLRTMTVRGEVSSLACSRDATRLVSGDWNGDVVIWNLRTGARGQTLVHGDSVSGVAFAGETVISGGWDHKLKFWSLSEVATVLQDHLIAEYDARQAIHAVAVSPDERSVATVGMENRVSVWRIPAGK